MPTPYHAAYWAERHRRILLIVPASLRKQWQEELRQKFALPSVILGGRSYGSDRGAGIERPFARTGCATRTSRTAASPPPCASPIARPLHRMCVRAMRNRYSGRDVAGKIAVQLRVHRVERPADFPPEVLEDESDPSLKWFRPGRQDIHIFWNPDQRYEPDFIVETAARKLLVEVKAEDDVDDAAVQGKARAGVLWCSHATAHAATFGGKPWQYVLVPDSAIVPTADLAGLVARYGMNAPSPD